MNSLRESKNCPGAEAAESTLQDKVLPSSSGSGINVSRLIVKLPSLLSCKKKYDCRKNYPQRIKIDWRAANQSTR